MRILFVFLVACAATAPPVLPLRRVQLYENGVGYFERAGSHEAGAPITLPIAASRVDDVLKSLVVLHEDASGAVRAVELETRMSQSRARALAGLPDGAVSFCALATSLKGSRVSIDGERGRLIEVLGCDGEVSLLLLRETDGAIVRFKEHAVARLVPLEAREDLDRAVIALSSRRAESSAPMTVHTSARGRVAIGYVSEAPLWRVSYRVVTAATGARLQAWALVHNDSNEAWQDVALSLMSGQPDTFLFPLAAPRYVHRPVRAPEDYAPSVPQLARRSPDDLWDEENATDTVELGGVGRGYGASAYGSAGGSFGAVGGARGTTSSDLLKIGALVPAKSEESGALFRFDLAEPVSLAPRASKLVPLIDVPIDAQEITWLSEANVATAALLVKNDTAHLLPSGPLAWYRDGSFSGEGALDRLDPKQRRVLQLGSDLAIKGARTVRQESSELRAFTWDAAHATLIVHRADVREVEVSVENRSQRERVIYCPLGALVENAKVDGAERIDFEPMSKEPIAVFRAAAGKETRRALRIEQGVAERWPVDRALAAQLAKWTLTPNAPAAVRDAAALAAKERAAFDKIVKVEVDLRAAEDDVARLKELVKAVTGDEAAPLVQRLAAADDKLAALKRQRVLAEEQVNKVLEGVTAVLAKL